MLAKRRYGACRRILRCLSGFVTGHFNCSEGGGNKGAQWRPGKQAQKSRPSAAFLQEIGLFQTRHLLDGAFQVFIGARHARAFWRHGVDTGDGLGQDAVEAALVIGTFFPGCGVTDFRCAQQTCAVARAAMLGNDVVRALSTAATS